MKWFQDILKGTEHVTFPVGSPSLHIEDIVRAGTPGTVLKVCMLSVSISNTLFDSWTTRRSPVASSSFCFHSRRVWNEFVKRICEPPKRPLWWIVNGKAVCMSSLLDRPLLDVEYDASLPGLRASLCLGWSVKLTRASKSKGIGWNDGWDQIIL
jgi:hypothetical protein